MTHQTLNIKLRVKVGAYVSKVAMDRIIELLRLEKTLCKRLFFYMIDSKFAEEQVQASPGQRQRNLLS